MTTKIAFGSCSRAVKYPNQPVWTGIAAQYPDLLILMGDQQYMDFGLPIFGGNLYAPSRMSFTDFVDTMYSRYKEQFDVPEFQALLQSRRCPVVHMTWDDHDFAWNNAVGGRADAKHHVPEEKRRASRQLFEQFRLAIANRPIAYPQPIAWPNDYSKLVDLGGTQSSFAVEGVRCILLDLHTWADMPGHTSELLGAPGGAQDTWLDTELAKDEQEIILVSSLTLSKGTCWHDYPLAYERLLKKLKSKKVLVLSGDIHANDRITHANPFGPYAIYEATSSGLAITGYKFGYMGDLSNSGLVEIAKDRITVDLFRDVNKQDGTITIDRGTWQ